jgi:hypothetical protein
MTKPEQANNQGQPTTGDPLQPFIQAARKEWSDPHARLTSSALLNLIQTALRSLKPELLLTLTPNAQQWLAPDALKQLAPGTPYQLDPNVLDSLTLDALQWLTPAMVRRLIQGEFERLNPESFSTFVASQTDDQLRDWLLSSFQADDFPPFILNDEPSAVLQLHYVFGTLTDELQERFRAAITAAIAELNPTTHADETFIDLLDLAVSIRATATVPILSRQLNTYLDQSAGRVSEDENVVDFFLAALHGFAPHPGVEKYFGQLYERTQINTQPYAAQLLLGLCTCAPDNFPDYLPRFIQLAQQHPNDYAIAHIIDQLEEIVPLEQIAEYFPDLDDYVQAQLLDWLCTEPWSRADLTLKDESLVPDFQIIPREAPPDAEPISIKVGRRARRSYLEKKHQDMRAHGAVHAVAETGNVIAIGE